MKKLGYILFALIYRLYYIFPRKPYKIFAVVTHDAGSSGNVGMILRCLCKEDSRYRYVLLRKEEADAVKSGSIKTCLHFFFVMTYHMATASYILEDNIFLPMAYMKFHKDVKVVQLWHGTATIKKFGQDFNQGELKELERRANSTTTHLVVNSHMIKETYSSSFGIEKSKIFVWGSPRTDVFFHDSYLKKSKKTFFFNHPECMGKRLVLYAPTLRDDQIKNPKTELQITDFLNGIPEDIILLLRFHPYVAEAFSLRFQEEENWKHRVVDVSREKDIARIMSAADLLITDYSSIIYEYCISRKPMVFYAYDLEIFSDYGRGFYREYESYVPGSVVKTTKELAEQVTRLLDGKEEENKEKMDSFIAEHYEYVDGASTARCCRHIFSEHTKERT